MKALKYILAVIAVCAAALACTFIPGVMSGGSKPPYSMPSVDPAAAKKYAEKYVSIGTKQAGSEGAAKTAEWIKSELEKHPSLKVSVTQFTDDTPDGQKIFRNITAQNGSDNAPFAIIACHYDTKKLESAPDFQGANDGASGVAALLAAADAIATEPALARLRVRLMFLDGEEALYSYAANDGLHGSRKAADELEKKGDLPMCRAFILLDMIGDADLKIMTPKETSPILKSRLQSIVSKHKTGKYFDFTTDITMYDDHIPFLAKGVPAIDMIDFEYGRDNMFWHTSADTLDKISGESMTQAANHALALAEMMTAQ